MKRAILSALLRECTMWFGHSRKTATAQYLPFWTCDVNKQVSRKQAMPIYNPIILTKEIPQLVSLVIKKAVSCDESFPYQWSHTLLGSRDVLPFFGVEQSSQARTMALSPIPSFGLEVVSSAP